MKVSKKTLKTLETAKQKETFIFGYNSTQIEKDYTNLMKMEYVEVGYRSCCGTTDRTHKVFKEWLKVLKCLKKDGFIITEQNVTHANKYPTSAQGFWNSIIYKIKTTNEN